MVSRLRRDALPRLMLVGGADDCPDLLHAVAQAVAGGLELFQLRDKGRRRVDEGELARSCAVHPELRLLVNGRPELARRLSAGLHLPEAMPLPEKWPKDLLWGRSVHSLDAALTAAREGADYLVLGTIFPSDCKPGLPGAGLGLVSAVSAAVQVPVFAIGGIDATRVAETVAAGAYGVAVRSAILAADAPGAATRSILGTLSAAGDHHARRPFSADVR